MLQVENELMRDKRLSELEEGLLYTISEKEHNVDFTEDGQKDLSRNGTRTCSSSRTWTSPSTRSSRTSLWRCWKGREEGPFRASSTRRRPRRSTTSPSS